MNKKSIKKVVILLIVIILVAIFKIFDLGQYLTLSYIKGSQVRFAEMYSMHQVTVIAVYMLIYIVVTALSLPGAAVLTLAGGALFGLITGTIIVSFASTIGATLACFVSRYLLQDWVQKRFGDRLSIINGGIDKEGAFYLFTLRLIPAFPFFVINLVMGLTKLPLLTFYWVSQIGMLPGTIVFINAGRELARIDSLSGLLSPRLIISFLILGTFPIIVKKVVAFYKSKKAG